MGKWRFSLLNEQADRVVLQTWTIFVLLPIFSKMAFPKFWIKSFFLIQLIFKFRKPCSAQDTKIQNGRKVLCVLLCMCANQSIPPIRSTNKSSYQCL